MSRHSLATLMLAVLTGAALLALGAKVWAQSERPGDSYASIARLPDWSGLWDIARGGAFLASEPSLTSDFAARAARYRADQAAGLIEDTPAANCVPPGLPVIMWEPYPFEILFTPGKVTIVIEAYSQWRQIFTDGRPHPERPDPTFMGHSIGRWEGDTLVVDTIGISTDTPLGRNYGARHSDRMRMIERMTLTEGDLLEIETTVHDPVALTEPWMSSRVYGRHRDWTLTEYICQQNNRNFTTDDGKAGIDLEHEVER
jgi:hypothetical protein